MAQDFQALNPKQLGFGLMRLPTNGDVVDQAHTGQMIDLFLEWGYTYFDTAFPYHSGQSEEVVKPLLSEKHPRDSYTLASKFPIWIIESPDEMQKTFDVQLQRTGAEYFDFYLLHAMSTDRIEKADALGVWDFMKDLKARGLAKHIGCSFHDTAEVLDGLLTAHPEMEFVQLQINYMDWDNDSVQSRLCYEVARKHNKPIIIMEPIKGGMLSELTPETRAMLAEVHPDWTPTEWALRFTASLDGVFAILSGMSNLEQMQQNIDLFDRIQPLNEQERALLRTVVDKLNEVETIPCTACAYCVEACPQNIQIHSMIRLLNNYKRLNFLPTLQNSYHNVILRDYPAAAGDCIGCASCEGVCPQNIPIIDTLKEISALFDNK